MMKKSALKSCQRGLSALIFLAHSPVWAQESEKRLGEIQVEGGKSSMPAEIPATIEGVSAARVEETVNTATTGGALKYLPSIVVRERYIGDRNGIVSTRNTGTIASAQSVVYGDGFLLSNLLGNSYSYPPRWGMVSPEEIDRIDVIYGPFSALYPGNSMGGVVTLTTRMPEKFEAHAALQAFQENFDLYDTRKTYPGGHGSASVGGRSGNFSFWISADRLESRSHPMSFSTATLKPGAGGVPVTGAIIDRDPNNAMRLIVGGYGIDHTVQNQGKIKLAYDFTPSVRAVYTLGLWQNTSDTSVDPYLKNAAGQSVYNTAVAGPYQYVRIGNQRYTLASLNPGHAESEHWMQGLSLKTYHHGEWNGEAVLNFYRYQRDLSRSAGNIGLDSGRQSKRPGGTLTDMSGTGWQNLDLRAEWRPGADAGQHRISFGYHFDRYVLDSVSSNVVSDWLDGSADIPNSASRGKTATQAFYLQDAWNFTPEWKATFGARWERWRAYDGQNTHAASLPPSMSYATRQQSAFSPKFALAFQATPDWALRASFGKATRFPTVTELFQTITTGANRLQNDPNLKPESAWSGELSAERASADGSVRVSLFQEDKKNALYSQTDITVTPNVTSIQNIDKIRTTGIETAWQLNDLWVSGLDLSGSLTYAHSMILANARNPGYVGNKQPRIPDWRATLLATYRPDDKLSYTLAARYSGQQHNSLNNQDINRETYGGASRYFIVDARLVYKLDKSWKASLGVNNLNDAKAYVAHPWPRRTFFAGVKFDY